MSLLPCFSFSWVGFFLSTSPFWHLTQNWKRKLLFREKKCQKTVIFFSFLFWYHFPTAEYSESASAVAKRQKWSEMIFLWRGSLAQTLSFPPNSSVSFVDCWLDKEIRERQRWREGRGVKNKHIFNPKRHRKIRLVGERQNANLDSFLLLSFLPYTSMP